MPVYQASVPVTALVEAPDETAAVLDLRNRLNQAGITTNPPGGYPAGAHAVEVRPGPSSGQGSPGTGRAAWPAAGDPPAQGRPRWGRRQETTGSRWGR